MNNSLNGNFRKTFLYKKLSVMIRTLLSMIKFLPLYSLFRSHVVNFNLEYEIKSENNSEKTEMEYNKIQFNNYSDSFGQIKLEVSYMNKQSIFQSEEEMNYKTVNEENIKKRQKFLSQNEGDYKFMNKCDSLSLKRNNSKSLESNIFQHNDIINKEINFTKVKPINVQKKSETTIASSNFISSNNFHKISGFCQLINNDDFKNKINEMKDLNIKYKNMDNFTHEEFEVISDSDSSFLNVSDQEKYSEFELDVEEENCYIDEINKSYIEDKNSFGPVEIDKILYNYIKIKKEIKQSQTQINFSNFISKVYSKK